VRPGNGWLDHPRPRPKLGVGIVVAVFGLAIVGGMIIGVSSIIVSVAACPELASMAHRP
jgi:hypothetical protein